MREELVARGGSQVRSAVRWLREKVVPPVLDITEIEDYVEDVVKREHGAVFAAVVRNNGTPLAVWPKSFDLSRADEVLRFGEAITVPDTDGVLAWFHLGLSLQPMQAQLRDRVERLLLRAGASAALVGLAIWLVLRRVVVQPLKALDLEAVRLGRGELERPLADHGRTEIGRLGRTLDEMRKNLAASHAAVADQNKRLRELDRLKSEFLANMSHEMRTPLTSILGEAEILSEATVLHEEASVSAHAVHRN